MTELTEALNRLDNALNQTALAVVKRLQPGLTRAEIVQQTNSFSWELPPDIYALYQWYNGLAGTPGKLNLVEKLLRLKGRWHGELSGRENELHLKLGDCRIIVKFLPLDYALAGHRHLKLGRCLIDLLPIFILSEGKKTFYGMIRLDVEKPVFYFADGTNVPPLLVTEDYLSKQIQYSSLTPVISFLIDICQQASQPLVESQDQPGINSADYELNPNQFDQLYQLHRS